MNTNLPAIAPGEAAAYQRLLKTKKHDLKPAEARKWCALAPRVGSRFTRKLVDIVLLAGMMLGILLHPQAGGATTRTVTSDGESGPGTLRETIAASAAGDSIIFSVNGTITLTGGELAIGRDLTIVGPGAKLLTVSGNGHFRVFNIISGTVNISGLTISGGNSQNGGAIYNGASLTVSNCTISGNSAIGHDGGGVENAGTAAINDCTISGNSASDGGGIANDGTLTLNNCTICCNTAVSGVGGGILSLGPLTVNNCTISGNLADVGGGGGIYLTNGTLSILNSIIANNAYSPNVVARDVFGAVSSKGHNLVGTTDGSSGWLDSDLTGTRNTPLDPLLGPLQNNGGPTPTMYLLPGSAAINAGDDSVLGPPLNLTTDQRAYPRRLGPHVDIGAVEIGQAPAWRAGTDMFVPSWFGHFARLPRGPGIGGHNRVFFGTGDGGQQGIFGIRVDPMIPQDPVRIADTNTPIPGGSGNFTRFTGMTVFPPPTDPPTPPDPCISGTNVVFAGFGANNQQGIYAAGFTGDTNIPIDPIKIADFNTPVPPGGLGNFGGFISGSEWPPEPSISGNMVAFFGEGAGVQGIYTATLDGTLTRIADTTTLTPDSGVVGVHFVQFYAQHTPDPSISGNNVVFPGLSENDSGSTTIVGVYLSTDGVLSRVADNHVAIPGGGANFSAFETTAPGGPQVSWGNVLFWAQSTDGNNGLYLKYPDDPTRVVVDTNTPIPGGSGNFTGFSSMSLSRDTVAFVGLGTNGQMGIYVSWPSDPVGGYPGDPAKVIDLNDTLDGKTITGLSLSRTGVDRDQNLLAFGATFSDGTQALYTINVFTGVRITSLATAGTDLQLSFASEVGHSYTVQSRADPASGSWSDLVTQIPGSPLITQNITLSNALVAPQGFFRIKREQ